MTFLELLKDFGIETKDDGHHHCRPGWVQVDCPYCGKNSGKFHLGYNLHKNYLNCWKCGPQNLLHTFMELTGTDEKRSRELLRGLEKDESLPSVRYRRQYKLKIPRNVGPLMRCHKRYLTKRGFDWKNLVKLWKIGGIGLAARLSWRIFIPIHLEGQVVSWTTRSISDTGLRYLSASEKEESVPHKEILYGEDYCRHSIMVCEGPLDVWAVGPGAVATCGIGFSREQLYRISCYTSRIVCFDAEPAAQRRARLLCHQLQPFGGRTTNVSLETGKDPSRADPWEIRQLREVLV